MEVGMAPTATLMIGTVITIALVALVAW